MGKADLTRQRILDAATAEFAAHGFAGARMDRIAATAPANKSQIYGYFGDKETLFDLTLERALENGAHAISVSQDDLPEYAGALYDHLQKHPELFRLGLWRQLERPQSAAMAETESWGHKRAGIASEQRAGRLNADMPPGDLLALVLAITQAWDLAAPGIVSADDVADRRAFVIDAVRCVSAVRDGEDRAGASTDRRDV